MKNKEELNALKEEFITMNEKAAELTKEEMEQVSGGTDLVYCPKCKKTVNKVHTCASTDNFCMMP